MNWEDILADRTSRMKASEIRELLKLLDQPDIISFAGGIPDPALFPADAFRQAYADIFASGQQKVALQYSVSEGYAPLRQWLAGEMAKLGIPCGTENILITSGSQQALDYLGKLFLSSSDTALVTWPTYLGALGAFNAYEPTYANLNAVLDQNNANKEALPQTARAGTNTGRIKFAYASVDFANPTGETMNLAARTQLLDAAEREQFAIIEDAAYQALRYDGEALPPILALDIERNGTIEATRTLYCGSFSKTLAPGLRIGWICAASPIISKLVLMKQAADLHSPTINQMVIADVVAKIFDEQVEKVRTTYRARRDRMLTALAQHMPPGVEWTRPEGGMFIWLTLPKTIDGATLLAQSLETEKVAFVPGKAFFADGSGANTIRLSFSATNETIIDQGIARLGNLLRAQ
ncbi:MAG: PLP-dependent aminotransferase family protein [Parvibaculum sp.]